MPAVNKPANRKQDWRTPRSLYLALQREILGVGGIFTLDVAASNDNTLCPGRYFTEEEDALAVHNSWIGNVWCNPPYAEIGPWVEKAIESVKIGNAEVVAMLLPSRTGSRWFELALGSGGLERVIYFRGRIAFWDNDNRPVTGNNEDSLVLVFRRLKPPSPVVSILNSRDYR